MQIGPGLMLPMLRPSGATALPPSAWEELMDSLQSEDNGMVLYFTDPDYPRALIRENYTASGELVTNGTFTTDTTGWTATNSTLSVSSNRLQVTNVGANFGSASQLLTVVVGGVYTFSVVTTSGTSTPNINLGTSLAGGQYYNNSIAGTISTTFIATSTNLYVVLRVSENIDGRTSIFDNVTCQRIDLNVDTDANSVLTYTSPALKNVMGADGTIKYANHNLCLQSQTFSTTWANTQSGDTDNAAVAPDGTTTADKFTENTFNGFHYIRQTVTTVTGRSYIASVYLKKEELSWAAIGIPNLTNGAYYVDLTNGVEGTIESAIVDTSVTSVGDGWYRCTLQFVATGTTHGMDIFVATANDTASYAGSGTTRGIYVWGAELKAYPVHDDGTLSDYVPTTTAARYRLPVEYDTAGDPVGLLVEEARTNLFLRSEEFDHADYTKTAVTVTANAIAAPDGTTTMDRVVETTATSAHTVFQSTTNLANATAYTVSYYMKYDGRNQQITFNSSSHGASQYANFDLQNGALGDVVGGTARIESVGDGIYRCSFTATSTAAAQGGASVIGITSLTDTRAPSYAGSTSVGVYLWGAQLEAGSTQSSYIRTTSATVTRAADNISLATSAMPYSATAGSMVANASAASASSFFALSNGTSSERIFSRFSSGSHLLVTDGGSEQANIDAGGPTYGQFAKVATAWAANDFAVSLDGGAAATDASGTLPTVTTLYVGSRFDGAGDFLNSHIKYIKYLPRRVANADLQTETA